MVSFTCNKCNSVFKKKKVQEHLEKCKSNGVTCIDCLTGFDSVSVELHMMCLSEKERYDKNNVSSLTNNDKGRVKQLAWTELVVSAIDSCSETNRNVHSILMGIKSDSNIPRKRAKFNNFIKSKFRFAKQPDIDSAWQLLEDVKVKKFKSSIETKNEQVQSGCKRNAEEDLAEVPTKKMNTDSQPEQAEFSFIQSINEILAENDGKMKVQKFHKKLIAAYNESPMALTKPLTDDVILKKLQIKLNKGTRVKLSDDGIYIMSVSQEN